jgi:hypothetical protein
MMSQDGGKVVPTDGVRPSLKKGLDLDLFGIIGVFRHGLVPLCI